jgi:mannan endo-1,4-beta-mannosidase
MSHHPPPHQLPPPQIVCPSTSLLRALSRRLLSPIIGLVALISLGAAPGAIAEDSDAAAPASPGSTAVSGTLREHAAARDFRIGAAADTGPLSSEPAYQDTLAREFNAVTAENAMKWDATEPSPGQFTFSGADAVVDLAEANDQAIHGHVLVWHNQTPGWVQSLPASELQAAMEDHIAGVVGRYRGRIASWDVVNEVLEEDGSLRNSFWLQTLGPNYIADAFRAARQADPDATLFINDYNVEGLNAKSDGLYNLVRDLRAEGVPIDGVGLQGHLITGQTPGDIEANIARFAALGVEVKITELDIRMTLPPDPAKLEQQAGDYRRVIDACLAVPQCTGVTTWGFTDKYSWVPEFFPGQGAALPFDESYTPKPAYDALHAALAERAQTEGEFVSASGDQFVLDGQPIRYGGTNNYYLHYKSNLMVDDVFDDAAAMNLGVIRAWTFLECGGDRPNSAGGCSQGQDLWMQRWSDATNGPIYNTGPGGLERLDYMLAKANETGIKLIMVLTNNWPDFGGMDQYVAWHGLQFHDQFYTDPAIRQNYKDWVATLINRVNSITGVRYGDDPAIFSWELANEPRCINASLPTSGTCTQQTLIDWADEMSTYIKSIDPSHMVSVGDEGFLDWGRAEDWPYNGTDGVDHEALTALPNVDFGTFHLYPDHWGRDPQWGTTWIDDHMIAAAGYGKPVILEEFGYRDQGARDSTYQTWTEAVRTRGGDGWNFWILTGIQDDGQLYPDFDGFRVVTPSSTATVLSDAALAISGTDPPPSGS